MSLEFEKYAAKGNEFVKLVTDDLDIPRNKAARTIRAVLHALRNRLNHEESFQLMAQLPVALKGVYVDGWQFDSNFTRINNIEDFLEEVRKEDMELAGYDFGNDKSAQKAIAAVFRAMNYFVSEGEFNDFTAKLPEEVKKFIRDSIAGKEIVL
jgi:uncharacterized protein (DUF2267 family)